METKVCKKCGRELPIGKFHKGKNLKDGYKNICKSCKSVEAREWRIRKINSRKVESTEAFQANEELVAKTKICPKCGKELPVTSFYIDRKTKSGYASYCKRCQSLAVIKSRESQIEKIKQSHISEFTTEEIITELKSRMSTWGLIKKLAFN